VLSKNAVVKVRKALEKGYIGKFTVTEHKKVTKPNHTTGFSDVDVLIDQPCRLSFSSSPSISGGSVPAISQTVKLFFAPEITVKEGSKITVTQNGVTTAYKQSGTEAVYSTHKEIILELWDRWA
jgi:hypothetical protein